MNTLSSPLITTILPTYRRPALLARAITSVTMQTCPELQVCVYDNASNDGTEEVVKALSAIDPRISYFRHEVNIGAQQNFAFGSERVRTPYFSFLSDDDFLLPGFHDRALAEFRRYPEALFVIGGTLELIRNEVIIESRTADFEEGFHAAPGGLRMFIGKRMPHWAGILFRREILDLVGGLDGAIASIDDDFLLRSGAVCSFSVFPDPVAMYCHDEASASHTFDAEAERRQHHCMKKKLEYLTARMGPEGAGLLDRWSRDFYTLRMARGSVGDILRGNRTRAARRIDVLREEPSTPAWVSPFLRALFVLTSNKLALRVLPSLTTAAKEYRHRRQRTRNRTQTERYRPLIDLLESQTQRSLERIERFRSKTISR